MSQVNINKQAKLSEHFTLGEMTRTYAKTEDGNIPSMVHIENLRRLCGWLEKLRARYNERYVFGGKWKVDGGKRIDEEPILINSAYRSPQVNKAIGGVEGSNHLQGCAADIKVLGLEQAIRYATILLDIADESREEFDELLIERSPNGTYWLHFAVRPPSQVNRHKVRFIQT